MWQSCGERRSIVEGELWASFRELHARLERVDFSPELDHLFFFLWEVERC